MKCSDQCGSGKPSRRARFRRDRVTIKKQNTTTDKAGQPIASPLTIANGSGIRCSIVDVRGSEYQRREQIEAGVEYVVEMRYRNDIEPTYELLVTAGKHLNKTMDVVAVIYEPSVGKPRETHLFCKYKAS